MYLPDTVQGSRDKNGVYIFKGEWEEARREWKEGRRWKRKGGGGGGERGEEELVAVVVVMMVVRDTKCGLQNQKNTYYKALYRKHLLTPKTKLQIKFFKILK